ncbi:putative ABC transport system ATP-binding protein [Clostridium collagenovorans DSM 3089]|uniref:Putative ABC transport system ATP-binding protein n=1 Tax=Clostridium collagenovorans DSM 3089 TaxID=1121306 RepID=A0A1M5V5U9_9CLOT|nr:ABC transporter ATP-binding protein [Clostridium collagenovorans]SHH70625.1 putative ABC transport system ATP-binding protein [Clostridium collagenovorans DSM 3089]
MEILNIENLTKVYSSFKGAKEVNALGGINLTVNKGEFVGIMGPSGSGKTTLLNILSGVDRGTSGKIIISNKDVSKMKKDELALFRRKNIGYIFQDFNLLDSLTLEENISLPLILDKKNPKEIEKSVNNLMNFFNILDLRKKYPYHISGGQKQRVAAARALVNDPAIIFADEPTGNLDSKSANNIMTTISKMNDEINSTVLMVTHDSFAASFCKRIVFIKDGKIKMEIASDGDRKKFFDKILEVQSVIGGEN